MEKRGTVVHVGKTQEVSSKDGTKVYKKRDLIVRINEDSKYPPEIKLTANGDEACAKMDELTPGTYVAVQYDYSGRSYFKKDADGKPTEEKDWFTTLDLWRWQILNAANNQSAGQQQWANEAQQQDVPF